MFWHIATKATFSTLQPCKEWKWYDLTQPAWHNDAKQFKIGQFSQSVVICEVLTLTESVITILFDSSENFSKWPQFTLCRLSSSNSPCAPSSSQKTVSPLYIQETPPHHRPPTPLWPSPASCLCTGPRSRSRSAVTRGVETWGSPPTAVQMSAQTHGE